MNAELRKKYIRLKEEIARLNSAIVAFSGGVDSALVLKVAHDVLGDKAIAVTADSPSLPRSELEEAKKIAKQIGSKHLVLSTKEIENKNFAKNPINRCYYCKSELYRRLKVVCAKLEIKNIINGTNFDDLKDYRPGLQAAEEFNVVCPLSSAKFTKEDIRKLANHFGLEVWSKPSSPCLSSRIPYNHAITLKKLSMVEEAEKFLKAFGIKDLRVRHFGRAARIEVHGSERKIIENSFSIIQKKFTEIGFRDLTISQFKSGSLNSAVDSAINR